MTLIGVGLAMTAVMQSSTAAIAVTLSAYSVGAVSLEQGAALIIGQNIGTATSSALAAIGAGPTAQRLALGYVLFKLIAALVAIVAFPLTAALMKALAASVDGTTLLAAYHTVYNVVGVDPLAYGGACRPRRNRPPTFSGSSWRIADPTSGGARWA